MYQIKCKINGTANQLYIFTMLGLAQGGLTIKTPNMLEGFNKDIIHTSVSDRGSNPRQSPKIRILTSMLDE